MLFLCYCIETSNLCVLAFRFWLAVSCNWLSRYGSKMSDFPGCDTACDAEKIQSISNISVVV